MNISGEVTIIVPIMIVEVDCRCTKKISIGNGNTCAKRRKCKIVASLSIEAKKSQMRDKDGSPISSMSKGRMTKD